MASGEGRVRINLTDFLAEYVRGASEEELRDTFSLSESQLIRVIGILEKKGKITEKERSQRSENLTIRFGGEQEPPDTATYCKGEVELDSGLVLHCPSCGAAVKRGADTCEYCDAHLDFSLQGKTLICPHCFARTSADGRFCMRCAKPIKGSVAPGKVLEDRLCPRCQVAMRGQRVGDFSVAECSQCAGVFVPHETFEMMQESRDAAIFPAELARRESVEREKQIRYVRCPICHKMMNRRNFARISGVIIDSCRDHGIWFDAGEIEKIMNFVARGGLQKAKAIEIENMKSEEKLMKLRNMPVTGGGEGAAYPVGLDDSWQGFELLHMVGKVFGLLKDLYR
jgi:Zn-finger nucleic acid-binding protein